jgi:hypothetical protein
MDNLDFLQEFSTCRLIFYHILMSRLRSLILLSYNLPNVVALKFHHQEYLETAID